MRYGSDSGIADEQLRKRLLAIGWECDSHTAMPGAGVALQFAQRLGIGRYVPCILLFTDVGTLDVDIMPVGGMRPSEINGHLQQWIDTFYEANHAALERWNKVEEQITDLVCQTETSRARCVGGAMNDLPLGASRSTSHD